MLISARNWMLVDGELSAKSYIQDGLIAMWDGIENAGWGVHDANATVWKDLVGNIDVPLTSYGAFGTNFLLSTATGGNKAAFVTNKYVAFKTIELCCEQTGHITNYPCPFQCGNNNTKLIVLNPLNMSEFVIGVYSVPPNYTYTWKYSGSLSSFAIVFNENFSPTAAYSNSIEATPGTWVSGGMGSSRGIGTSFGGTIEQSQAFKGKIYFVRLYSRALTADEIAANYAVDKARFNLP